MKPLHIPKIRELDLTEGFWWRRERFNALVGEAVRLTNRVFARRYPITPLPATETVRFRRPLAYIVRPDGT